MSSHSSLFSRVLPWTMLCLMGCPGPTPPEDVRPDRRDVQSPDVGGDAETMDVSIIDVPLDTTMMDRGVIDTATDGPTTDTGPVDPCTPVATTYNLVMEGRLLPRFVGLGFANNQYLAANTAQRFGIENLELTVLDNMGAFAARTNVSLTNGSIVEGASFVPDIQGGGNLIAVYDRNPMQNFDLFARRFVAGEVVNDPEVQLTTDAQASQHPRIVSTGSNYIVVWRSEDRTSNTVVLRAMPVSSALVPGSAVTLVTAPENYAIASDGTNVAVVYTVVEGGVPNVKLQRLNASNATALGAAVVLASDGRASDSVSVVASSGRAVALWATDGQSAAFHVRPVDFATGTAGTKVDLTTLGSDVSRGGLAIDGANYVLAFRRVAGTESGIAMVRLNSSFAPRENASSVDLSSTGEGVNIIAGPSNQYAIGWSDSAGATATSVRMRVMRCP